MSVQVTGERGEFSDTPFNTAPDTSDKAVKGKRGRNIHKLEGKEAGDEREEGTRERGKREETRERGRREETRERGRREGRNKQTRHKRGKNCKVTLCH